MLVSLRNCGQRCIFCGLNPSTFGARRMLVAGHIKPWKDSAPGERLDPRNGLAACPSHDVAFNAGLLTVGPALQIHVSETLAKAVCGDPLTGQYYGRPLLLESLRHGQMFLTCRAPEATGPVASPPRQQPW